mgnify:CR=1 FL=1
MSLTTSSPETFWNSLREHLLDVIPADTFRVGIDNMRVGRLDQDGCELITPNEFSAIWIRDNYLDVIKQEADRLVGRPFTVELLGDLGEETQSDSQENDRFTHQQNNPKKSSPRISGPALQGRSLGINPKNTFSNFIVGGGSELAHAACIAVSNAPAHAYNPLFLYGDTGLGKTHLMHAIGWKIKQSDKLNKLYFVPGNGGTKDLGTNINSEINDFESIKKICLKFKINMFIVGPEAPLVNGICDFFKNDLSLKNIIFIGPSKLGSKLEGSKDFAKKFLIKNNIPTAKYKSFNESEIEEAKLFLDSISPPYVIKADGLAGGKGVLIFDDITKAKFEINEMLLNKKFGDSSKKVIIEEFLDGIELSVFLILDGENYIILPSAKD